MLEAETEAEDIECRHKWPKLSKKLHTIGTTRLPIFKYDLCKGRVIQIENIFRNFSNLFHCEVQTIIFTHNTLGPKELKSLFS